MVPLFPSKITWILTLLIAIAELTGCVSVETPDEVARYFWDAMENRDKKAAQSYATEDTRVLIGQSDFRWPDAQVTFDEIHIKGNHATIHTQVGQPKNPNDPVVSFQTVLRQEDGNWKVDYKETMSTVSDDDEFSELMRGIRKFNRELSENLDDALSKLKKEAPKLEREMETLGNTVRKSLEEFAKELDKLLKKPRNGKGNQTEKGHSI